MSSRSTMVAGGGWNLTDRLRLLTIVSKSTTKGEGGGILPITPGEYCYQLIVNSLA